MVGIMEDKSLFDNTATVIFDSRKDDEARTQWLANRTNSIGGSEIAKIAGYSKYGSALTVYNDKMDISERFKGNIHTKFGNRMEPIIREWVQEDFQNATGIELTTFEYPFMMISKYHEFISANIDGLAKLSNNYRYYENLDTGDFKEIPSNELLGIEIKTSSEFLKKMWAGEEIPDEYYCQVQWYMYVTGLKHFLIIYLLGKEVKWKVVPRNEEDIKFLVQSGINFWTNNILAKVPPKPSGLSCETKEILYQQSISDDIEIPISENKLETYKKIDKQIKDLSREKEKLKQLIYQDLGNSLEGTDGLYKVKRWEVTKDKPNLKLLKEKYPVTYSDILEGQTKYTNMKISKIERMI